MWANSAANLIVMGAYAHSRVRELILGGATRAILTSMTVPVLMRAEFTERVTLIRNAERRRVGIRLNSPNRFMECGRLFRAR